VEQSNAAVGEAGQQAKEKMTKKSGAASTSTKGKKKDKEKTSKKEKGAIAQLGKERTSTRKEEGRIEGQAGEQARTAPPDPLLNPEAKGRGLQTHGQPKTKPAAQSTTTSRGECSGQKKPDS
jgi:hypothetical protein